MATKIVDRAAINYLGSHFALTLLGLGSGFPRTVCPLISAMRSF